jgi:hypothetical protein
MGTTINNTKRKNQSAHRRENGGQAYTPAPEAPRSARRVAMRARREQDRRLTGW